MMMKPYTLNEQTSGVEIPATFHAVTGSVTRFETFLSYSVPMGYMLGLLQLEPFRLMLKTAGGSQLTSGRMLIGWMLPNGNLVKEFGEIPDLSLHKSLGWINELNRNYRHNLVVDLGRPEAVLFEGSTLVFQVYDASDTLPSTPNAGTYVKYMCGFAEMSNYARQLEAKLAKLDPGR